MEQEAETVGLNSKCNEKYLRYERFCSKLDDYSGLDMRGILGIVEALRSRSK